MPVPEVLSEVEALAPRKEDEDASTHKIRIEKAVRAYFNDIPVLAEIARCESRFRHLDYNVDGEVIRGEINDQDVGVMQINEKYHLDQSEKLGFDIHSFEGNLAYARYLYEKEGTRPWNSSRVCWGKSLQSKELAKK